jgi:hypothetical protein
LPGLDRDQHKLEVAVESPLTDFLDIIKTLRLHPRRLLLILFEHSSAVRLHGERELLRKAIHAMTRALEAHDQGYSLKDLDALDEIWRLIDRDRRRRDRDAYRRKVIQRNQDLGNRRANLKQPQFLAALRRYRGTVAEIAAAIEKEFHVPAETVERRIRRQRAAQRKSHPGSD